MLERRMDYTHLKVKVEQYAQVISYLSKSSNFNKTKVWLLHLQFGHPPFRLLKKNVS